MSSEQPVNAAQDAPDASPTAAPRTRRAVLAAGAAAAVATVASGLRPMPTLAAPDDNADMYVGIQYGDVSQTTGLVNNTNSGTVFYATSGHSGVSILGTSANGKGVQGSSTGGWGVYATSSSNAAIVADSASHHAVYAQSFSTAAATIIGWNRAGTTSTGVQGYAGTTGSAPDARPSTGVMGTAAGAGTGGYFASESGNALHVAGKAKFSRSGVATVGADRSYVDVTVPGGLAGSPGIVATLQRPRGTTVVTAVRKNYPSAGKARIYLNKAVTSSTAVAWIVFD